MSAFWALVKKELNSVMRDRTIIIAIVIQLFIASFSSALLIGMLSLYDADSVGMYGSLNLNIGVVGSGNSQLVSYLKERGLTVMQYPTLTEARSAFFNNKIRAILSAPQINGKIVEIKLYLPHVEATASLIRMVLQEPLKHYENYLRQQQGVDVHYSDLKGQPATSFEFIYSVILPVLMFFPAFVTGSMVVDSLSEEVEHNTLQTLLSAPISINGVVCAKITAAVILSVVQCMAWLGLLGLNQIDIRNAGWVLLLAAIVAGLAAVGSALVAVLFKDRERSQFVYSLVLLAAAGVSYLTDISPIKTLSRLSIGDFYTSGWNVMLFAAVLAVLLAFLLRSTCRLTL